MERNSEKNAILNWKLAIYITILLLESVLFVITKHVIPSSAGEKSGSRGEQISYNHR